MEFLIDFLKVRFRELLDGALDGNRLYHVTRFVQPPEEGFNASTKVDNHVVPSIIRE
jgi:hypothetical protein